MPPRVLVVLATVLAVACLWPLFLVFQWFGVNVATMERMTRTDPLGFRAFPAIVMFLRPTLAALAALTALRAGILVITSPPQRAFAILMRAAIVQGALVLATILTGPAIDRTLARMVPLFEDRQTPGAIIAADFTRMQVEASATILPSLITIAVVCAVVAVMNRRWKQLKFRS
jgi:hypothetical protein